MDKQQAIDEFNADLDLDVRAMQRNTFAIISVISFLAGLMVGVFLR